MTRTRSQRTANQLKNQRDVAMLPAILANLPRLQEASVRASIREIEPLRRTALIDEDNLAVPVRFENVMRTELFEGSLLELRQNLPDGSVRVHLEPKHTLRIQRHQLDGNHAGRILLVHFHTKRTGRRRRRSRSRSTQSHPNGDRNSALSDAGLGRPDMYSNANRACKAAGHKTIREEELTSQCYLGTKQCRDHCQNVCQKDFSDDR